MSQHRKLTMERKRLLQFLPGFERSTFRSRVRRATNALSPLPGTLFWETAVGSQAVKCCMYECSVVWSFQRRLMPTFTLSLCRLPAFTSKIYARTVLIPKQSTDYYVMICAFQSLPILNFPFPKLLSNGLIQKQSTDYYVMICAFQSLPILNFPFPKFILERFDSETVNILLCHDMCLSVFADSQLSISKIYPRTV